MSSGKHRNRYQWRGQSAGERYDDWFTAKGHLVDARDGQPYFYDINALSNFVADAPAVIGFDPFVDLASFIIERAEDAETALAV